MFAKFRHRSIGSLLFILAFFAGGQAIYADKARGDLPLPTGLSDQLYSLPEGLAEVRAKQPLENAVKSYQLPEWITKAQAQRVAKKTEPRMHRGALREFGLAQLLLHQGKVEQAMQRLRLAKVLSPQSPEVYRKLGNLFERMGDSQRALSYYKDLLKITSDDAPSLYVLGKNELNKADNKSAIALLDKAHKEAKKIGDDLIVLLSQFQLAQALQRQGHDLAAVEVMKGFFEKIGSVRPSPGYMKDYTVATQSQPIMYMLMGDSLMRLKEHAAALDAYQKAEAAAMRASTSLSRRLIYVHMLLNKPDKALLVLQKLMNQTQFLDEAMALSRYWITNTKTKTSQSPQNQLIEKLEAAYVSSGRPASLAIGLSEIKQSIEKTSGWELLSEHLAQRPEDTLVYRYLLDHVNKTGEAEKAAIITTLQLMTEPEAFYASSDDGDVAPGDLAEKHYELAAHLYGSLGKVSRISKAVTQLAKEQPGLSIKARWLLALCHLQSRYPESALAPLKEVLKAAPQWQIEMRRVVMYALDSHLVDESRRLNVAKSMLEVPYEGTDKRIQLQRLLAQVELDSDRKAFDEAIKQLDKVIGAAITDKTPIELVLAKADVLWLKGEANKNLRGPDRFKAAIQFLGKHRKLKEAEKIYERLYSFQNLMFRQAQTEATRNTIRDRRKETLEMGVAQIPKSRVVRFQEAIMNASRQEEELQAASLKILINLYKEDGSDTDVLLQILDRLIYLRQPDQARRLMESAMQKSPDDLQVANIALWLYSRIEAWEVRVEVEEKVLLLQPKSTSRDASLAEFYLRWGRVDEAYALMADVFERDVNECRNLLRIYGLTQQKQTGKMDEQKLDQHMDWLIKEFPDEIAELRYERAVLYDLSDKHDKAVALLIENQKLETAHTPSLNFLGYHYARLGENLKEAEKLLKKALAEEGNNAAYQDSLAWIYYKQGNFKEAVKLLETSATESYGDPVILDHLGDTYWQLKRYQDAQRMWRYSQSRSERNRLRSGTPWDSESNEVTQRVKQKLEAAAASETPRIAPVGASDIWQNAN